MKKQLVVLVMTLMFMGGTMVFAEMPGSEPDALWQYITKENRLTQVEKWQSHKPVSRGLELRHQLF